MGTHASIRRSEVHAFGGGSTGSQAASYERLSLLIGYPTKRAVCATGEILLSLLCPLSVPFKKSCVCNWRASIETNVSAVCATGAFRYFRGYGVIQRKCLIGGQDRIPHQRSCMRNWHAFLKWSLMCPPADVRCLYNREGWAPSSLWSGREKVLDRWVG